MTDTRQSAALDVIIGIEWNADCKDWFVVVYVDGVPRAYLTEWDTAEEICNDLRNPATAQ